MNLDALSRLLRQPRFLGRGAGPVLAAVPELVDGAPVLTLAGDGVVVASSVGPALSGRVGTAVEAALADALAGRATPLDRRDPVVAALVTLMSEGLNLSPGAGVVPLLQLAREAAAVLAHPSRPVATQLEALRALPPGPQGQAWARVASALQGRIGLCCAEVAGGGHRVPALAQAILGCRLALLFPPGGVDPVAELPVLLGVTNNPLPPAAGQAAVTALRVMVGGLAERRAARRSTGDDEALFLGPLRPEVLELGVDGAVRRVLGDPLALAVLVPSLVRFTDAKALARAGVPEETGRALLTTTGLAAALGGLGALAEELRRWEVLSALAHALQPVDPRGRADRALLVPHRPTRLAVVGVGLGSLRSTGADRGASPPAVERAWREIVHTAAGAASVDLGAVGLLLLDDVGMALRMALRVGERFVAAGGRVPVAVAWGVVLGGTDGETTRVSGPAVDAALRWIARPGGDAPVGRRLGMGATGLVGDGVAVDQSALAVLLGAWKGPPTAIAPGVGGSLGLHAVLRGDEETLAFARVGERTDGFELLVFSAADWAAIERAPAPGPARFRMGHASEPGIEAPVAPARPAPPVVPVLPEPPRTPSKWADSDPFADEVMEADFDPDSENLEAPLVVDLSAESAAPPADPFRDAGSDPLDAFLQALDQPGPAPAAADPFMPSDAPAARRPAPTAIPLGATSFENLGEHLGDDPSDADFAEVDQVPQDFSGFYLPGVASSSTDTEGARAGARSRPLRPSAGKAVVEDDPTDETPRDQRAFPPLLHGVPPAPPPPREPTIDFGFVLDGYVVFHDRGRVVFGRPYGRRLVDSHSYETGGDVLSAYPRFLADKIAEGFVPRTDLVSDLPAAAAPVALDQVQLSQAWRALA